MGTGVGRWDALRAGPPTMLSIMSLPPPEPSRSAILFPIAAMKSLQNWHNSPHTDKLTLTIMIRSLDR